MSETEAWTGKAKIVRPKDGEDVEALCERICKENNINKLSSYLDTWREQLRSDLSEEYVVVGDVLYNASEKQEFDTEYLCHASRIDSDTIEFKLVFYNGGTCFSEMLEEAIMDLEEE